MISLRQYQQDALDTIMQRVKVEPNVLLQAATGAGKTIIFSALIKYLLTTWPKMRIAILAHRQILIEQAKDKLTQVFPEARDKIGIVCASTQKNLELDKQIIVCSRQTLINHINDVDAIHLLIVDECHRLQPMSNTRSEYYKIIDHFRTLYSSMRLIGVTATPYRLKHGYIYGEHSKQGVKNWFTDLAYSITISELQDQKFLCPCKIYIEANPDLEDVKVSSTGEFNEADLEVEMTKSVHLYAAVYAVNKHAEHANHIVVFAITTKHADKLAELFRSEGYSAVSVHTNMPKEERETNLAGFESGRFRVVVNVGVLTEGWDCTNVDCMVMCRPTMAPALFIQMIGRGLRIHEGKDECLLLDLSGNWQRHIGSEPGHSLDDPIVLTGRETVGKRNKNSEKSFLECPNCHLINPLSAIECEGCGHIFVKEKNPAPEMVEAKQTVSKRYDVNDAEKFRPFKAIVRNTSMDEYLSKKGNRSLRIKMDCLPVDGNISFYVNTYLSFEGNSYYYTKKTWRKLAHTSPPTTLEEAIARCKELQIPDNIWVQQKGQYYNVYEWV